MSSIHLFIWSNRYISDRSCFLNCAEITVSYPCGFHAKADHKSKLVTIVQCMFFYDTPMIIRKIQKQFRFLQSISLSLAFRNV